MTELDDVRAEDRLRLAGMLDQVRERYAATRRETLGSLDDLPADLAASDLAEYETDLAELIVVAGSADATSFRTLVGRLVAQVTVLEATKPDGMQPHLGVLNTLNDLQVMGVAVPPATVDTVRSWLVAMPTERIEPQSWHWQRGWAALALGDQRTARTLAAVAETGPTGVDPETYPEFDMQAWYAFFLAAVLGEVEWPVVAARWEEFLLLIPVLAEIRVFALRDLPWVARVVHAVVAASPVGSVSDWLRDELVRIVG